MDIDTLNINAIQTYTQLNAKGNKRQKPKHFQTVKKGDKIAMYQSGEKKLKAFGEITASLHTDSNNQKVISFKKIENAKHPLELEKMRQIATLSDIPKFVQGSLYNLTKHDFDVLYNASFKTTLSSPLSYPNYTIKDIAGKFLQKIKFKKFRKF